MRILDIALKDLRQVIRDRKSLLFLVLMPVLFTVFLGFAFRGSGQESRLPVAWVDHDPGGALTPRLQELIAAAQAVELVPLADAEAERAGALVREDRYAAAVVVPAGFSAQAQAGTPVPLTVITVPGLAAGQTASTAVQAAAERLLGAVESARLSVDLLASKEALDAAARQAAFDEALAEASAAWQAPPLSVALRAAAGVAAARPGVPSGFVQSSPGMIVQFAVFSLITSAMVLVLERNSRTLQRLRTAPIRGAEIIAGHTLAMFVLVLVQAALLVAFGQIAFGVDYLRQPVAVLLVVAALGLWVASLGLLIGTLAKTDEQVVVFSLIAMFLFSALGGAWFPLEIAGRTFSRIGHVMPTAWAMDGLQNVVVRGQGLGGTLLPAGILLAYALAFFGLAVWRFRRT